MKSNRALLAGAALNVRQVRFNGSTRQIGRATMLSALHFEPPVSRRLAQQCAPLVVRRLPGSASAWLSPAISICSQACRWLAQGARIERPSHDTANVSAFEHPCSWTSRYKEVNYFTPVRRAWTFKQLFDKANETVAALRKGRGCEL